MLDAAGGHIRPSCVYVLRSLARSGANRHVQAELKKDSAPVVLIGPSQSSCDLFVAVHLCQRNPSKQFSVVQATFQTQKKRFIDAQTDCFIFVCWYVCLCSKVQTALFNKPYRTLSFGTFGTPGAPGGTSSMPRVFC